jgi:hypothetical protein
MVKGFGLGSYGAVVMRGFAVSLFVVGLCFVVWKIACFSVAFLVELFYICTLISAFYGYRIDVFEGEHSGPEGYCGFDDCVFSCRLGLWYFSSVEYVGCLFRDDLYYFERLWA